MKLEMKNWMIFCASQQKLKSILKKKSRKMEEQLSEKSGEVQELYAMVAELKGTLKEKECEISKLEEDVEDQRQEIKIREYENETYLQNMREYEEMIADFEEKGKSWQMGCSSSKSQGCWRR